MTLSRIARTTAIAAALCASAAICSATSASAEVVDVTIIPGLSSGPTTPYGAGCTYLVVARTAELVEPNVSIVDMNRASTMFPQELIWDTVNPYFTLPVVLGHAVTLWTPTAPGEHSLMAYQTSAGGPVATVMVNPATPIGPGCIVAP
ncbi:hypothetical protein ACFQ6H_16410 [Rhodococcus sp. NPDC056506]|uniref:hypothetical protein n=1 Tax=Rhodococcus sp. NPDC056506 TaxID=3345844 RepID=UPI00366B8FA1